LVILKNSSLGLVNPRPEVLRLASLAL